MGPIWHDRALAVLEDIRRTVPGARIRCREDWWLMRVLGVLVFWTPLEEVWQCIGKTIVPPAGVDLEDREGFRPGWTLAIEHEGTHLLDRATFYGLCPTFPWWMNAILFDSTYLLAFPWPGIVRGIAELRAHRRDVENRNGMILDWMVQAFRGPMYLWMWWPVSEQTIRRLLAKPSPYRDRFDAAKARSDAGHERSGRIVK